jgi:hypothetical protein
MAVIPVTPTAPVPTIIQAPVVLAPNIAVSGATITLDLRTRVSAWMCVRMGRRVATALGRAAYVAIRRTHNGTLVVPAQTFDVVSQTATAISTTVATASVVGASTLALASGTGFVIGDTICLHSEGVNAYTPDRVEFNRIIAIPTANSITVERPFRSEHNVGDRVTNLADVRSYPIPGGDIYEITCINNSGQAMVFAVDALEMPGDTITT